MQPSLELQLGITTLGQFFQAAALIWLPLSLQTATTQLHSFPIHPVNPGHSGVLTHGVGNVLGELLRRRVIAGVESLDCEFQATEARPRMIGVLAGGPLEEIRSRSIVVGNVREGSEKPRE